MADQDSSAPLLASGSGADNHVPDLLLFALALGGDERALAGDTGFSAERLKRLPREQAARYTHLRLLRAAGQRIAPDELSALMRARLAEMLLKAETATELAALLRVGERLGQSAPARGLRGTVSSSADPPVYDFDSAVAEARRLLSEIDAEETAKARESQS
jgi:hypothetical protein